MTKDGSFKMWGFVNPRHIGAIATATRAAYRR
jgi:hypothetical protein